jgi:cytoskeletal protein CcmA (bactofilin family)
MGFFRKDNNRDDSFQRQISGLRRQPQGDDEHATDEFRHASAEQDDAAPFSAPPMDAREDLQFAPSRITDETQQRSTTAARASTQSFRPTFQAADATTSVIAVNAQWNGTLRTDGSVHIHGKADGELHATNDVFVAEGAEVDAQLFADNVIVAGEVRGKIEARGRLELLPQGHVAGDVHAPKLIVHEGARLSGQLKMDAENSALSSEAQGSRAPFSGQSRVSE